MEEQRLLNWLLRLKRKLTVERGDFISKQKENWDQGDVAAMFTMPDKTIKGIKNYKSLWGGAKYWFSSAGSKAKFY